VLEVEGEEVERNQRRAAKMREVVKTREVS
jgi:hypothetical protein